MNRKLSRRLLQVTLGLLAAAPLLTGLLGFFGVVNPVYASNPLPENVLLDSNLRFLNGFSVGIAMAVYYIIPNIESQTLLLRAICGIMSLGALGRLLSICFAGLPPFPMPLFIVIEIMAPPILVIWQNHVLLYSKD